MKFLITFGLGLAGMLVLALIVLMVAWAPEFFFGVIVFIILTLVVGVFLTDMLQLEDNIDDFVEKVRRNREERRKWEK